MTVKVSITVVESMVSPEMKNKSQGLFNMATHLAAEVAFYTGGATVTGEGYGTWFDEDGKGHSELNRVVFTYTNAENVPVLRDVAIRWRDLGGQLCILFVVEDVKSVEFL